MTQADILAVKRVLAEIDQIAADISLDDEIEELDFQDYLDGLADEMAYYGQFG